MAYHEEEYLEAEDPVEAAVEVKERAPLRKEGLGEGALATSALGLQGYAWSKSERACRKERVWEEQ